MEKLSSFLCSQWGSAQLRRTLQPHFFFLKKKKPPGSEPPGKQHLQARASANTHPDLSPWKTSGSRPNSLPAQHSRTTYPPTTHPARSRAISPPSTLPDQHFSHQSQSCKALLPQVCSSKHAKEVNRSSCSPSGNQPQESQRLSLLLQSPTRTRMLSSPFTFSFNL